jgi:hypothetical protein
MEKGGLCPPAELSLGSPRSICPEMKQGSGASSFISAQILPPEAPEPEGRRPAGETREIAPEARP